MTTDNRSTADIIMAAARELSAANHLVTREALSEITGLKLSIVDDRVKYLTDHGQLNKRQRGVYEPADNFGAPRVIFHAVLPNNAHKIEIGDDHILTLTPQEARTLGHMMAGAAFAYQANELAHQAIERNNELTRQVAKVGRKMRVSDVGE